MPDIPSLAKPSKTRLTPFDQMTTLFLLCEAEISHGVHYAWSCIEEGALLLTDTLILKPMKGEASHSLQRSNVSHVYSTADQTEAF